MSKLSEYDENLSDIAKAGIKSAKSDYQKAKQSGDTVGMAKANAMANNIRKQYGGYTGGDDGSSFYPVKQQNNISKPSFNSGYDSKIKNLEKRIMSRDDFSYNPEHDPVYQLYKKVYTQMGNDAYDRALAQKSIKTGGIVNTDAVTSAVIAQNVYNTHLADKATELYNSAYQKYKDSVKEDYDILNMLRNANNTDYNRFVDSMDNFFKERDFEYKKYNDELDLYNDEVNRAVDIATKQKEDDREYEKWLTEFNYQKYQDDEKSKRWQAEYELDKLDSDRNYELKSKANAYNYAKLGSDTEKWKAQLELDKYNTLAKLIKSVYDTDEIVDIEELKDMLGL